MLATSRSRSQAFSCINGFHWHARKKTSVSVMLSALATSYPPPRQHSNALYSTVTCRVSVQDIACKPRSLTYMLVAICQSFMWL
eukprot:5800824-Amphidinium_carterae.2